MIYFIRFDALLDAYVRRTFESADGCFCRRDGEYICGRNVFGSRSFGQGLEQYALSRLPAPGVCLPSADYFFVLGDCHPADNMLLDVDGKPYCGKKAKYYLSESDIKIDSRSFNRQADFVFGRLFRRKAGLPDNAFAVAHRRLGCGTLRAFLTCIFGQVNCRDLDGLRPSGCIVSSNDLLEASVPRKYRLNGMGEAKAAMFELRQYVSECTGMDWSR